MVNPFKKYRIDYLLFSLSAGFVLILVLVISFTSYQYSSRELVSNTSRYQRALLEELNKQLNILFENIEQSSLTASRSLEIGGLTLPGTAEYERFQMKRKMVEYLAQLTYSSPSLHSIDVYIPNLDETYSLEGYASLRDHQELLNQSWYPAIQETDSAWIGQHIMSVQDKPVELISFARKIYSYAGQYQGILVIHIKAFAVQEILKGRTDPGNVTRVLLDSGNRWVAGVGGFTRDTPMDDYLSNINSSSGYMQVHVENSSEQSKKYLMSWSHFYNTDWLLVEMTPWRQITAGSIRVAVVLLMIGVIGAIIIVFFAFFVARQFTKPVSLLLTAMSHFAVKQEVVKLPIDYRNEFGSMFIGFRKLTEHVIVLYDSLKQEFRQKKEAEIAALQAMINPHFLYNTLDQVNWMAIEAGQDNISDVLELMGKMFRIGLSNGEKFITIQDEITHMTCYLRIQQIRWGEGLEYEIEIEEALLDGYVPKLILQPFVENAVVHGFHGRTSGKIVMKGKRDGDDIIFRIIDNGVGISQDWADKPKRKTGGYGIRNVAERIEIYYGASYGITIFPLSAGGTEVTIRMRLITDKAQLEERGA
ncbi:sensor histidine kinase [Paenibacillus alkaliterrae]|uniref:cache domain-containing sensor histidine kinase n=1 Tax=Paenibacillus alkaliterrae TaxID=320909 RepID=UPI001F3987CD|nr:sensor histidine kinase [Paenibacillus alkaliterrae]MCF2940897.1 sensor histidine kinase [Paenibacillus alkaliterrae]